MEEVLKNGLWVFTLIILIIWVLFWKGYALWTSARLGQKRWFIALAILNTFGLLDIYYIFYIAKKNPKSIRDAFKTKI